MNTKHTPGPWKAHHGWEFEGAPRPEYPDWCEVVGAKVNGEKRSINGHFGLANARLIAAAPELLEACKTARDSLAAAIKANWEGATDQDVSQNLTIKRLDAAIAKATGEAA